MLCITRQNLGNQDFSENTQKNCFGPFSNAAEKPLKNPAAAPGNGEKPSKNTLLTIKNTLFERFGLENPTKGGRALARAPLLVGFRCQNVPKKSVFEG